MKCKVIWFWCSMPEAVLKINIYTTARRVNSPWRMWCFHMVFILFGFHNSEKSSCMLQASPREWWNKRSRVISFQIAWISRKPNGQMWSIQIWSSVRRVCRSNCGCSRCGVSIRQLNESIRFHLVRFQRTSHVYWSSILFWESNLIWPFKSTTRRNVWRYQYKSCAGFDDNDDNRLF